MCKIGWFIGELNNQELIEHSIVFKVERTHVNGLVKKIKGFDKFVDLVLCMALTHSYSCL